MTEQNIAPVRDASNYSTSAVLCCIGVGQTFIVIECHPERPTLKAGASKKTSLKLKDQ